MSAELFGATLPGRPRHNFAFMSWSFAYSKSTPPGAEAISIILTSGETYLKHSLSNIEKELC